MKISPVSGVPGNKIAVVVRQENKSQALEIKQLDLYHFSFTALLNVDAANSSLICECNSKRMQKEPCKFV